MVHYGIQTDVDINLDVDAVFCCWIAEPTRCSLNIFLRFTPGLHTAYIIMMIIIIICVLSVLYMWQYHLPETTLHALDCDGFWLNIRFLTLFGLPVVCLYDVCLSHFSIYLSAQSNLPQRGSHLWDNFDLEDELVTQRLEQMSQLIGSKHLGTIILRYLMGVLHSVLEHRLCTPLQFVILLSGNQDL